MSDQAKYPIVYVRGYAGSRDEIEDAVADPYMGFQLGSTKIRQSWDGTINRYIFESPLIRLMKDFAYRDTFMNGEEVTARGRLAANNIWIYRYYEPFSQSLGNTEARPEIEEFAEGLGRFLQKIREKVCGDNLKARKKFKVYLVAHSMGGLVVRCWLQNKRFEESDPVTVDKVFTYATPHRGIDFRLIGNMPRFVKINNTENFNEERMRSYLKISSDKVPVHSLDGKFPEDRFFCLIGSNAKDYTAAFGLSSKAVGPMSDGLVKIRNAYVAGSPRAFVHRSHSGHFGIVNSEEGYQNLVRFFFGDLRVDGCLEISDISLPPKIARAKKKGKEIRAAYHIEVVTKVRDARWDLYRRTVNEQSAIHLQHEELDAGIKKVMLFSSFLSKGAIIKNSKYMGFAVDLRILAPEYVVDNRLYFDDYFEGASIFRDKLTLMLCHEKGEFVVKYGWDQDSTNKAQQRIESTFSDGKWVGQLPVEKLSAPGIKAQLVLTVSRLN